MPAGKISSVELSRLATFLNNGKALYIEGNDFARDYHKSDLFELLGLDYIEDGNPQHDIQTLRGQSGTFSDGMIFDYAYSYHANYKPDVIRAVEGTLVFASQDEKGYAIALNNGIYRVITSSFVFGALIDGDYPKTKTKLMRQYMSFFQSTSSVKDLSLVEKPSHSYQLHPNFPNPFNTSTTIQYDVLIHDTSPVKLTIYNNLGQTVRKLVDTPHSIGSYRVNWNGRDDTNDLVQSGVYFCRLETDTYTQTCKLILVR